VNSIGAVAACAVFCLLGWLVLQLCGGQLRVRDQVLLSPALGVAAILVLAVAESVLGWRATGLHVCVLGLLLLCVVVARRPWREKSLFGSDFRSGLIHLLPGLLLVAVVVIVVGGLIYPPDSDSITNTWLAQWFLQGHIPPPLIADHLAGTNTPEIRFGVGLLASVVAEFSGLNAGLSTTVVALFAIFAMPGCLMVFCSRLGCNDRAVLIIGFVSLGFGFVPFRPLVLGQQPLTLGGFVMAPCAVIAVWDALQLRQARSAILAVLLVAGLYYVHFSDGPTAVLLFATLGLARFRDIRISREVLVYGSAMVVGILVCVLPGMLYHGSTIPGTALGKSNAVSADQARLLVHQSFTSFLHSVLPAVVIPPAGFLVVPFALVGAMITRRRRETVALFVFLLVLLLLQMDSWMLQWPRSIFVHLVPWADPERLAYLDWFPLVALAGIAVDRIADFRQVAERSRFLVLSVGAAAVATPGLLYGPQLLAFGNVHLAGVSDSDVSAISELHNVVPQGDLILTDGIADGGAWIPLLSNNQSLLSEAWQDESAAPQIEKALRDLCGSNADAELSALGIKWVYLGPKLTDIDHYADRSCLGGTPQLRAVSLPGVSTSTGPWLFEVTSPA